MFLSRSHQQCGSILFRSTPSFGINSLSNFDSSGGRRLIYASILANFPNWQKDKYVEGPSLKEMLWRRRAYVASKGLLYLNLGRASKLW